MKQRSIFEDIWRDTAFSEFNPIEKTVCLYCLTNSKIKLIPAFRLSDREIMFDTGATPQQLQKAKKKLLKFGIILKENYCILKTEYAVFNYTSSKLQKPIQQQKDELPKSVLSIMTSDRVSDLHDRVSSLHDRVSRKSDTSNDNDNENENENSNENENREVKKTSKKEKLKQEADKFRLYWNEERGKNKKVIEPWLDNYIYWRKHYSFKEMKRAVKNITLHDFWRDKMDMPELFFRMRNKSGNCDYIGDMLNLHKEKRKKKERENSFTGESSEQYKDLF